MEVPTECSPPPHAHSHPRSIHEVMVPNWKDLQGIYENQFAGMTIELIELDELVAAQGEIFKALKLQFTKRDRDFLMSFKRGAPDWSLFDEPGAAQLPAIRWKLENIKKLKQNPDKHGEQLGNLEAVLEQWLA